MSRAVLISLILHLCILAATNWVVPLIYPQPPQTIELSIDLENQIRDALSEPKKQITRSVLLPEKLKAPEDENLAQYLSEKKQRVLEQTRASLSGITANRSNAPSQRTPSSTTIRKGEKNDDGSSQFKPIEELHQLNALTTSGLSTVGETLPNSMKIGSFTALNTDRYLYYTFYARIEELIRFRWESRIQKIIEQLDRESVLKIRDHNWETHAEFLLDKNGFLQKALLMKESGVIAFDGAALNAFKDARVFPNPPKEMIQDDGYVHINFSFTVYYNPPRFAEHN